MILAKLLRLNWKLSYPAQLNSVIASRRNMRCIRFSQDSDGT